MTDTLDDARRTLGEQRRAREAPTDPVRPPTREELEEILASETDAGFGLIGSEFTVSVKGMARTLLAVMDACTPERLEACEDTLDISREGYHEASAMIHLLQSVLYQKW